jgi:sugar lactone lactonase YvrE
MTSRFSIFLAVSVFLCTFPCLYAQKQQTSLIETIAGATASDRKGTEFSFGAIAGLATDAAGNTYFTIQPLAQVFRLGPDGHVTDYAGNGVRGVNGEDVAASRTPLETPSGLAVDTVGNLFISSVGHGLLRVDAGSGMLSTVLLHRYRQPGSANMIRSLGAMAVGPDGLLYLADGGDNCIKSYSFASGSVTVLAGNGQRGPAKPGQPATSSPLNFVGDVAVGQDGTVYFTTFDPVVYAIEPGTGKLKAIKVQLKKEPPPGQYETPRHLALDTHGHLFIAQTNRSRVLRVDLKSGKVIVYAGTGEQGFNGDGMKADKATVTPSYIAFDSEGNLLIAENSRIRRVDASTNRISTVVGNGLPVGSPTSEPALNARLWEPANAVPAADGGVYITSSFSQRLVHINQQGELTTVAGGGELVLGDVPGPALQVALYYPQGIWLDANGDVYFSDHDNRIVRRLPAQGRSVTNFATTSKNSNSAGVFLYYAASLVADDKHFYLSDPTGHRVWRISRKNGNAEPYAGTGSAKPLNTPEQEVEGHPANEVELISPSGLALDPSGNLFIADGGYMRSKRGRILRVDAAAGTVTTVLSHLQQPSGLAFESPGILCFSEAGVHQVRCIELASGVVKTVAGTGAAGFAGDGGPAECAQLNRPSGISFDATGNLYIADTGNQRIRRVRIGDTATRCGEQ